MECTCGIILEEWERSPLQRAEAAEQRVKELEAEADTYRRAWNAERADRQTAEWMNIATANAETAEALRALLREVTDELSRWGWGDFHYGEQPQEARVVALVAKARQALGEGEAE